MFVIIIPNPAVSQGKTKINTSLLLTIHIILDGNITALRDLKDPQKHFDKIKIEPAGFWKISKSKYNLCCTK